MDDNLERLVKYYEDSAEATQEERARSERDRDYYDHKQITDSQLKEYEIRKQAPVIINYVQKKVNFLLGAEKKTRQDPKAFPRTPVHESAAHAASDAIRYVCDDNNFDQISSDAFENMLIEGSGAALIEAEATSLDDYKIKISRVPWDRAFRDPHSRDKDYGDATYKGFIRWMDKTEAEELAKKHGAELDFSLDESVEFGETHEDRPAYKSWLSHNRKRVKICYIWFLEEGVWHHAIYTKPGYIWGPKPSAYLDENGEPSCNLIMGSPMVDRENNRYGYVRLMIPQQDAINKRESKSIHLLSQRQTWAKSGAFKNVNAAKRELNRPDGHVEVNEHVVINQDFGILDTGQMALGQFQLLQEAKRDLDSLGNNGGVSDEGIQSGRALETRSQSGQIELTPFTDAHKHWKRRVYRTVWNMVRQFWPAEKWIRVTDDENNLQWVGLNAPVMAIEKMLLDKGVELAEIRQKYAAEVQEAIQMNPALSQVVETQNNVAELDVDIIIDEEPDIINIQTEQFMTIASIAERRGDIPTALLIKMSSLRNKDQILDELQGDEEQQKAASQQRQVISEAEVRKVLADAAEKEAKAMNQQAQAQQKMLETQFMALMPDPDLQIVI